MNRGIWRRSLGVAAIAALLFGSAACAQSAPEASDAAGQTEDLGVLRVVTTVSNSLQFIGVQAADELGVFDGSGLDIEVVDGTSPNSGQIMAGGQADIALTDGIRGLANIGEGLDATFVAGSYLPWPQLIIVRADHPAKSVSELKGANFGISGTGSAGHYATFKIAEKEGWSESDYSVIPLGNLQAITAALQSGAIDAFTWSADTAFALEEQGTARILGPTDEIVGPNVFQGFVVMNSVIEERPEALKVFFEHYFAGIEKLQASPDLAVGVLRDSWGIDAKSAEGTVQQDLPFLSTTGEVSEEDLKGLEDAAEFATGTRVSAADHFTFWRELVG